MSLRSSLSPKDRSGLDFTSQEKKAPPPSESTTSDRQTGQDSRVQQAHERSAGHRRQRVDKHQMVGGREEGGCCALSRMDDHTTLRLDPLSSCIRRSTLQGRGKRGGSVPTIALVRLRCRDVLGEEEDACRLIEQA